MAMHLLLDLARSHPALLTLLLFAAVTGLWAFWDFRLRPLLIPRAAIEEVADALVARYGPLSEEMAFVAEEQAWHDCDTYRQGKWRRVRRELYRRRVRQGFDRRRVRRDL